MRFVYRHQSRVSEPFEKKYEVDPDTGCWNWIRAQDGHGYGQYQHPVLKRTIHPHRFLYEQTFGPIPDELVVDHLCRNRLCVNPAHMEAVTQRENLRRGVGYSGRNAQKTHCVHGHPFSGDNLHVNSKGGRECLTCRHEWRAKPENKAKRNAHRRKVYAEGRQTGVFALSAAKSTG